ncbi:hypothetical protein NQD34_004733 [Periophthalmus magnuspinnatus]|nr:hypothetical protein NQD34_004733 [Periophthalmus magnuspinnatus]
MCAHTHTHTHTTWVIHMFDHWPSSPCYIFVLCAVFICSFRRVLLLFITKLPFLGQQFWLFFSTNVCSLSYRRIMGADLSSVTVLLKPDASADGHEHVHITVG